MAEEIKPKSEGRYDSDPAIARGLANRDDIQRQIDANAANVRMLLEAILGPKTFRS